MARRLPPLNALKAFEAAARHLSFSRAGDELNVTHAAISHQVKALEEHLGVPLFRRLTRAVRLTEAGQAYLPAVRDALDTIAEATAQVAARATSGPLTVSVAPSFATRWLVPRLPAFQAVHPDIDVRAVVSLQIEDFARSDTDAAIRHGGGAWPGLGVDRLMDDELVPVCSPELARLAGPLREPADLAGHTLLHVEPRANDWDVWLRAAGLDAIDTGKGQRMPTLVLALDAAISGLGVAIGDRHLVARDVKEGRLVIPFDLSVKGESAYYLVYPKRNATSARLLAFRDWLMAEVRAT